MAAPPTIWHPMWVRGRVGNNCWFMDRTVNQVIVSNCTSTYNAVRFISRVKQYESNRVCVFESCIKSVCCWVVERFCILYSQIHHIIITLQFQLSSPPPMWHPCQSIVLTCATWFQPDFEVNLPDSGQCIELCFSFFCVRREGDF